MEKKAIIYTALLGDYDDLKEHPFSKKNAFCFTDRKDIASNSWTIINIGPELNTLDQRIRCARYYKANSHLVLPKHQFSIWVDASLKIKKNLFQVISYIKQFDIATFKYPDTFGIRNCAYDEATACIQRGKDSLNIIQRQMQRYSLENFPRNLGLVETSIVVRKTTETTENFNNKWWTEIQNGSRRDQLSFNYVCWRNNIPYSILPGCRINNPFSDYISHKENIYSGCPFNIETE